MSDKKLIDSNQEMINAIMGPVKEYVELVLSSRADKFKRTETSSNSITVNPNECMAVTGTLTTLAVTLAAPVSGIENKYRVVFKTGTGFSLTVTSPAGKTVLGLESQTFDADSLYELSFELLDSSHIGCVCRKWGLST